MSNEEEFFDFTCPFCQEMVSYPVSAAGSLRECINCLESFMAPESAGQVARPIPIPITTSRLVLRRFDVNDVEALALLAADEEFFLHAQTSEADREEEIARWIEQDSHMKLMNRESVFRLAVEIRAESKLIGSVGFRQVDEYQTMITDVDLHPDFQHQGFALEAVDALLGFCFEQLKLHRVTASCDSRSAAGCRLFKNVGMRQEGEFIKNLLTVDGQWANTIWFAALAEEYLKPDDAGAPTDPVRG